MPKKTARRTRKHRKSPSKKVGLIATEKNADQSAKTKSALDNHFHRTALPISCGVITRQLSNADRLTILASSTMQRPSFENTRRQLHGLDVPKKCSPGVRSEEKHKAAVAALGKPTRLTGSASCRTSALDWEARRCARDVSGTASPPMQLAEHNGYGQRAHNGVWTSLLVTGRPIQ